MDPLAALMTEIPNLGQGTLIMILVAVLVVSIVLCLPPFLVLFSRRVSGSRKVWWFVLTSLFSWLAYVPFLFMVPKRKDGADPPKAASG